MTYTTVTDGVDYPQATHINQFATGLDAIELASWKTHQIFSSVTAAGNVGAGEDDLFSYTLPASTFSADTQTITANMAGFIIGHASGTRTIKIYFGGTQIFTSGALAETSNCNWQANVTLIRSSSSAVKYAVTFMRRVTFSTFAISQVTGLTLTNTQIFKVTGESSTATNNDVVFYMGNGVWYPAP